jgi:Gpi18-like mannosyltransferase
LDACRRAGRAVGRGLDAFDAALRRLLDGRVKAIPTIALWILASALFFVIARNCRYEYVDLNYPPKDGPWMYNALGGWFGALFAVTLAGLFWKLYRAKASTALYIILGAVWMCTLIVRISLMDYLSGDYDDFLSGWVWYMQDNSFSTVMSANFGDYMPPYLYFIYFVSRSGLPDMYMIKLVSIAFDYLAAYFVMKLVGLKFKSLGVQIAALLLALWGPTVLLNGAYWAQCDSIYTSFALGGLFYALDRKPYRALACFGITFAFKLQAIFILPIMLPLFGARRISIKHVLMFPLAYVAMMLPAALAGKTLSGFLAVYEAQLTNYPELVKGAPSVFNLLPKIISYRIFSNVGVYLTLAVSVTLCGLLYAQGARLTDQHLLSAAMTLTMLMPLLLPCMHERYFYIADVLGVAYLICNPRRWYIPCTVIFASFASYMAYFGVREVGLYAKDALALALVIATGLSALHLARDLRKTPKPEPARAIGA